MKGKLYPILGLVLLSLLVAAVPVNAQWIYEKRFTIGLADYAIEVAKVFEDAGLVIVGASNVTEGATDAAVWVLTPDLNVSARYDLSNVNALRVLDFRNGIIAVAGVYGNDTVVFVINHTEGVLIGAASISSVGGSDYVIEPDSIAISGDYIYLLAYDYYDGNYYLYVLDMTPVVINYSAVGSLAALARIEGSDYVVYWNGSSDIYIADGTSGNLSVVYSISLDLNEPIGLRIAALLDHNVVYVVYSNSSGTYFTRYMLGAAEPSYVMLLDTEPRSVADVSKSPDGVYVVTMNGYGYRIVNVTSPALFIEAIPSDSVGYLSGSEYLYVAYGAAVDRYALRVVEVTTTQTVTKTTTETQVFTEVETETETETVTVQGPYTEMDLVLVGLVCLVLGAAVAYIARRR